MSTQKKTAAPIVRFTAGAVELGAAETLRGASNNEATAFKAFYDAVIVPHDVPLSALASVKAGDKRSNEAQAAYDFTRRLFWIATFGQEIAAMILDANVKGDTVLPLSSVIGRNGLPLKDQEKRKVQQSFGGAQGWGAFVKRLNEIAASGEEVKRGASTRKSDREYVIAHMTDTVKRLAQPAEKLDGSIGHDVAPKLGKALLDVLAAFGIK